MHGKKSKRQRKKDEKAELKKQEQGSEQNSVAEPAEQDDDVEETLDKYKSLAKENMENQKLEEAQRCLEKAVYIAISAFGPAHEEVGTNLRDLSSVMHQRGMHEAAAPLMARAERILRAAG